MAVEIEGVATGTIWETGGGTEEAAVSREEEGEGAEVDELVIISAGTAAELGGGEEAARGAVESVIDIGGIADESCWGR